MQSHLRLIPATDACMRALREADQQTRELPQALLRELVNAYWAERRPQIAAASQMEATDLALQNQIAPMLAHIRKFIRPNLRPVINGTGVIIHTNLGRSVLATTAARAAAQAASSYCNLEMDLETGLRGSRHSLTEDLIRRLTGAESALVVNNNAAAVLLILDSFCKGGEVVISRGELVEIGGGFRVPDIMVRSGSILREVGTTNKTRRSDYIQAINENTRAILSVHASNFRIVGFHEAVTPAELKSVAASHNLPLFYDLGSGNLLNLSQYGDLPEEPTVGETIAAGADLVCFSGDKALGGPQAGIIAGKAEYVARCAANPLTRALRCDKLCLAALEATLRLYLDPDKALAEVPTARMLTMKGTELARAARRLGKRIERAVASDSLEIVYRRDNSRVGGGAFPEADLPTTLVCLLPVAKNFSQLRDLLLQADPPVIGRLDKNGFCLDPRTIPESQYGELASAVAWAMAKMA